MRFTKIRHANDQVELKWEHVEGGTVTSAELSSTDAPDPDFVEALAQLRGYIPQLTEWPADYCKTIEVTGISISYRKDRRGFVINGKRPVEGMNSPLVVHTPYLGEPAERADGDDDIFEAFDKVIERADAYLKGQRAQGQLPLDDARRQPSASHRKKPEVDELERKRREKEIDRALLDIVQIDPASFLGTKRKPAAIISDRVLDRFDGYAYTDGDGREWAHTHRHVTQDSRVVWCGLTTEGGVARFWYDIQRDGWDPATSAPTLIGGVLDARVLRAWNALRAQEAEQEEPATAGV